MRQPRPPRVYIEADLRQHFEQEETLRRDQDAAMAAEQARNEADNEQRSIAASERYWQEKEEERERRYM